MSVHVILRGRIGNNLFQYALGRIIAEHLGLELTCHQHPIPRAHSLGAQAAVTLTGWSEHFPNAPLFIPGRRVALPVEAYELHRNDWHGQIVDLNSLLNNRAPRRIVLDGFFQQYSYYEPYRDKIRSWLQLRSAPAQFEPGPRDVLVNIRRGPDFGLCGWTLPLSYYEGILNGLDDRGKVYICGTGLDDQVRRRFAPYDPIYIDGLPLEHFRLLTRFNRIVLSNSTFAWWGAFLSNAAELYAPHAAGDSAAFGFTGFSDIDLHMRQERYHPVSITGVAVFEQFIQIRFGSNPSASGSLLQDSGKRLIAWLSEQPTMVPLAKARESLPNCKLDDLIPELINAGLISVIGRYRDEP